MKNVLLLLFIITFAWATGVKKFSAELMSGVTGDEELDVPYYGGGQNLSPGDSVGWTKYDYQRNGQTGWQVWYDAGDGIHVDFMEAHAPDPDPSRGCAYNFNLGGTWYGAMLVNSERAGYVTAGYKPSNNAGVCGYHMNASGDIYRTWLAIDDDQGAYSFTEKAVLPQEQVVELIWPRLAIDDQGYFHVVNNHYISTGHVDFACYTRSTDDGNTWSDTLVIWEDASELTNWASGCFADRLNSPGKVIVYWTLWTGEGTGGHAQHSQDVWYMLSTDYGVSWGAKTNLTNYQPSDTLRGYAHLKGIFDGNGDPHLVWPVCKFQGGQAYIQSSIMHWSPSTGITKITGPYPFYSVDPGAWKLPSDFANIAVDRDNGWLYCVWTQGSESDVSAGGYPNGELMAMGSTDGGATWTSLSGPNGVNITNTPTPGGAAGACADDDYPAVYPYVEMINSEKNLIISYVEDKDAGGIPQGEGTETDNPYRVLVFPVDSIIGVEEEEPGTPKVTKLVKVFPNPASGITKVSFALAREGKVRVSVLDITGRIVENLVDGVKGAGYHTTYFRTNVPAGVYYIQMETEEYRATESLILVR